MVESGIAFKMPEEVWLDKDGVVVEEERVKLWEDQLSI
jgi:hypothetical protein